MSRVNRFNQRAATGEFSVVAMGRDTEEVESVHARRLPRHGAADKQDAAVPWRLVRPGEVARHLTRHL